MNGGDGFATDSGAPRGAVLWGCRWGRGLPDSAGAHDRFSRRSRGDALPETREPVHAPGQPCPGARSGDVSSDVRRPRVPRSLRSDPGSPTSFTARTQHRHLDDGGRAPQTSRDDVSQHAGLCAAPPAKDCRAAAGSPPVWLGVQLGDVGAARAPSHQRAAADSRGSADRRRDPEKRRGFVFVGRWVQEKGVDVLVEAYDRAEIDREAWPLVIVGDGPLRPRSSRGQRRGIDTVAMPGHLDVEARDAAIRNAKWMVIHPIAEGT